MEKEEKTEKKNEFTSDYFATYVKYHKFDHNKNNDPLEEYEKLAKHMNWGPNHYKDHRAIFLKTLKKKEPQFEIKKEQIDGIQGPNYIEKEQKDDVFI